MNTNAPLLVTISKICSCVALIGFVFLLMSSLALEGAGLVFTFIIAAFASLTGLVAAVALLIMGNERTGLLMLMLLMNALFVVMYAFVIVYWGWLVPTGVTETLNNS